MRYFKYKGDVYAFSSPDQDDLIDLALADNAEEITGEWPPAEIPSPSGVLAEINRAAAHALAELSATYPEGEVQSWAQQAREVDLLASNPEASVPLLAAISAARGLTVEDLAVRVRAKIDAYAVASGKIIGRRQALCDAVQAVDLNAPDAAAKLEAIHWHAT
jgi:hypothetical protein